MRSLRGGQIWQGGRSLAEAARRAEDAGHSTLLFSYHLHMLSPMPAMAAAAAVTLRLGVQVANMAFRPLG